MRTSEFAMSRWIAWVVLLALACSGSDRPNNAIEGRAHTPDTLKARGERQAAAERALAGRSGVPRALDAKQIDRKSVV